MLTEQTKGGCYSFFSFFFKARLLSPTAALLSKQILRWHIVSVFPAASAGSPLARPRQWRRCRRCSSCSSSRPMISRPRLLRRLKTFWRNGQNIVWRTRSSDDKRSMLLLFPAVWLAVGYPQAFLFGGDQRRSSTNNCGTKANKRTHTHAAVVSVNSSCFVSLPCRVWDAGQREENLKGLLVKVAFESEGGKKACR